MTRASLFSENHSLAALKNAMDHLHKKLTSNPDDFSSQDYADFFDFLDQLYKKSSTEEWSKALKLIGNHPLLALIHECPFTNRIFYKPRGYAGDARVLDYIYYGIPAEEAEKTTALGHKICAITIQSPAARAVRNRARIIGNMVDALPQHPDRKLRVLSIASGHLREMSQSKRFMQGEVEVVAIDQDEESLGTIRNDFRNQSVATICSKISTLLRDPEFVKSLGEFDFVYASGLFDYLDDKTAKQLSNVMYQLATPNGRVLITNFAAGIPNRAHMESFMAWNLIYRTPQDLLALASDFSCSNMQSFKDSSGNVLFLDCQKTPRLEETFISSASELLASRETLCANPRHDVRARL